MWTTFSPDQVDLNYENPEVLLRILDVLLTYADRRAAVIRLDAVQFLWKEEGTPSINHEKAHLIIRFLRACFDRVYPNVLFLTETNVPHEQNIAYLGAGSQREAQLVYQFALPPLVLHTMVTQNTSALTGWLSTLDTSVDETTFLNFLASHDGVGLRPAEHLLEMNETMQLVQVTREAGGDVSNRMTSDGSEAPYELNSTWFDLMAAGHDEATAIKRHLASHAIMLALRGIPAVYLPSLLGTSNDRRAYRRSGLSRALNRMRVDSAELAAAVGENDSRAGTILRRIKAMIEIRRRHPAFHPDTKQVIFPTPPGVFGVMRVPEHGSRALVLVNCTSRCQSVDLRDQRPWVSTSSRGGAPLGRVELHPWEHKWLSETPR